MLIINADDWGRSVPETDAALSCHARGAVTAVSAMVFMRDSDRAAQIALEQNIDVGLHLNLTEAFSAQDVPADVQKSHRRASRFLQGNKYSFLIYHPLLRSTFRHAYHAQAAEFLRLYGRPPSHVDGHRHMHLCSNLLLDRVLPSGQWVRRSFSFGPGEKSALNRAYRRLVDWRLARRYRLTDYFFALSSSLQPARMTRITNLAKTATVELMTHPFYANEYSFLMSEGHLENIHSLSTRSFTQL